MRVLLVDDHPLTVDALSRVLSEVFGESLEVLRAALPEEAMSMAAADEPLDLCVTDLVFMRGPEIQFLHEFRKRFVTVPIMVYSGVTDPVVVRAVLDAGALAYVPKRKNPEIFKNAVRNVLAGDGYVPPELLIGRHEPCARREAVPDESVNAREREIVQLMARLASRKAVARMIGLSPHTVKMYLLRTYRRLGVSNAEDAQRAIALRTNHSNGVRP